ncbi:hypothetical protein [Humidisolicoccus flavus]|uniref:hypothetical protein n=1 Tax=Humidisolicoccus flavus TaxID=3111414 RepID=UPI00324C718F
MSWQATAWADSLPYDTTGALANRVLIKMDGIVFCNAVVPAEGTLAQFPSNARPPRTHLFTYIIGTTIYYGEIETGGIMRFRQAPSNQALVVIPPQEFLVV